MTKAIPKTELKEDTKLTCEWDFSVRLFNKETKEMTARIHTECGEEILVNYDRARTYRYCPHCGKELKWKWDLI